MLNIFKKKNEVDEFKTYVEDFRKEFIPEKYNQIKLMDELANDDIDHYMSISNRTDGKTFNYLHFLIRNSYDNGLGFIFVVRKYTVRQSAQATLQKVIDFFFSDPRKFIFRSQEHFTTLIYEDTQIGLITDLNKASDLKYLSSVMKDFPIIVYDEFLALEGDYLVDEWEKLKTIYESIDRNESIPIIKIPKILYLGNAVNFSSPILANLNLFNTLENHPINKQKQYGNVYLELNRNDNANERRNLRAFNSEKNAMTTGQFKVNKHMIATEQDRTRIMKNYDFIIIKLESSYLRIDYNKDTFDSILSITTLADNYDYNLYLKDNNKESIYLDEVYYDDEYYRKYDKEIYLFNNNYSKDTILNDMNLSSLRINKIISEFNSKERETVEYNEKIYKDNYLQRTKKNLFKKMI